MLLTMGSYCMNGTRRRQLEDIAQKPNCPSISKMVPINL